MSTDLIRQNLATHPLDADRDFQKKAFEDTMAQIKHGVQLHHLTRFERDTLFAIPDEDELESDDSESKENDVEMIDTSSKPRKMVVLKPKKDRDRISKDDIRDIMDA